MINFQQKQMNFSTKSVRLPYIVKVEEEAAMQHVY